MKILKYFTLFIFDIQYSYCQINSSDIKKIFYKNHFALTLKGLSVQKGKVNGEALPYNPTANNRIGFEVGFDNFFNINKTTSINTGLSFGYAPRNFAMVIPKQYLPTDFTEDLHINGFFSSIFPVLYASVPITLEKRIVKKKGYFYYGGGINLKYALMSGFYSSGQGVGNKTYMELNEVWYEGSHFFTQLNLNTGYGFFLKNKDIIKVGLISNIALNNLKTGNYMLYIPNSGSQSGEYHTRLGFVGIFASYVFTRAKR
jgi:hypothetical protein